MGFSVVVYLQLLSVIPRPPSLSLSLYPQITQLKIEYNPFAKGFRGCELAGPRR